jgi:hypothetical protein
VKRKVVHFEKDAVEEVTCEEEGYGSPYLKYKPNETEEERGFKISGLVRQTRVKSSEKQKSIKKKFEEEIKSN